MHVGQLALASMSEDHKEGVERFSAAESHISGVDEVVRCAGDPASRKNRGVLKDFGD
ncbi:hypothetical protein [Bradyrhizobium sp. AUGA SZCCT0283]|uniref:hypothetical protein n=1 Tax=Bradyrhizobium sp. AUGA SZCCT0283 TaxID=2807671 RepID=UPI001BA7CE83|nr:hypothetical protein [Bradyrhizobium sp. AUGA SZCCT0283]MBR1277868.1 hypothetical protein [Bradyrhizobium sp. AUGA SZCCT0283]